MNLSLVLLILSAPFLAVAQPTWCGKNYKQGTPTVPPGGEFRIPNKADVPMLNFQCSPAVKPYLTGENASLIIDARITSFSVVGSFPLLNSSGTSLDVFVSIDGGQTQSLGSVPFNSTGTEFPLSLASLTPQPQAHNVTCTAGFSGSSDRPFQTSTKLLYLAPPSKGSVTKQDLRTGSLLVKEGSSWTPIFPIGFYTRFNGYLTNTANVDAIKARGLNVIHPVPTFDDMTAFTQALDRMEQLGLWLMYDMRFTYQNLTSVTEQVNMIKDRSNLLLWYTGDEPDGTSDPLNATKITYDLINSLDGGGYHPVSLVLNCQDYFFEDYSLGADILMQDTYPVDINASFSSVQGTPCTPNFGDCGCDNCVGVFGDISTRVDEFKQRLDFLGRGRSTAVWSVPQAFGGEGYWPRVPTGREWLVQSVIGINHGSLGIIPWDDPTSSDISASSSQLAAALPKIVPFLSTPNVRPRTFLQNDVDVTCWTLGNQTLLMAANPNPGNNISLTLPSGADANAVNVFSAGADLVGQGSGSSVVTMEAMSALAVILQNVDHGQGVPIALNGQS